MRSDVTARWSLRAGAAVAGTVATVVAVVGAVGTPATVLLSAALVSLVLLVLPAVTTPESARRPQTRRRTRGLLLAAAAVGPLVAGAHAAGVPSRLLSAAVLGLGSAVVVRWLLSWEASAAPARRDVTPAPPVDVRQSPDALADLFGVLPLEALFAEWRALRTASEGAPGAERERLVGALSLLLTELHRRDPEAARRWLDESPTDPPDRWFDDEPRGQAA
ncbi:hypothetical protein AB1207_03495 [Kineococcus endophyticus]|uniref:Uncharacterized protein n=1 Tax=Kineococcus endophyticus TaxID=1181883 RepID=A0ABV3P2F9_9ACTN